MIEDSGREKFTKIIQKAFLSSKIKNSIHHPGPGARFDWPLQLRATTVNHRVRLLTDPGAVAAYIRERLDTTVPRFSIIWMHGLWAEDTQKRNIFPPTHSPPPDRISGFGYQGVFWVEIYFGRWPALPMEGIDFIHERKVDLPSLYPRWWGWRFACALRDSLYLARTLLSPPFPNAQSTRLFSYRLSLGPSIGREYSLDSRVLPSPCPTFPSSGRHRGRAHFESCPPSLNLNRLR